MKQAFFSLLILWGLGCSKLIGQNSYRSGILPTINLNQKLEKGWRLNYQWQSRWLAAEGLFSEPAQTQWKYSSSDISTIVGKKIQSHQTLAMGVLVRFKGNQQRLRLLQQFAIVQAYPDFRLAHRFRADQSWGAGEAATFRLRYRLSVDFPLNGSATNPDEFYFKLNNEYVNALEEDELSLEIRLTPLLGYLFTDNNKVETGIDYRFSRIGLPNSRHSFWWAVTWYYSFS